LSELMANRLSDKGWNFYKFIEPDVYRLMCSWATTESDIDRFVRQFKEIVV
jgi:threonine aldolase